MDSRRDGEPDGKLAILTGQHDGAGGLIAQASWREALNQAHCARPDEREERNDDRREHDQPQLSHDPTRSRSGAVIVLSNPVRS